MARILHCIDPQPLSDGTCQNEAWIEQATIADYLPTPGQAAEVGAYFAFSLVTIAAVKHFLKPRR